MISKRGRNNIYEYPKEGVNQQLKNLSWVWDRGYYEQTKDGIWYNLFLNEKIKKEIEYAADKANFENHFNLRFGTSLI